MRAFTNMPTREYLPSEVGLLDGKETQSTRFLLEDGRTVEVTEIWVGPHNVIVMWPDGTASTTEWGSPQLMQAYKEAGILETVDASERPRAELPG